MDKQQICYMLLEDELIFLKYFFSHPKHSLIIPKSISQKLNLIESIDNLPTSKEVRILYLWNRDFSIAREAQRFTSVRSYDGEKGVYFDTNYSYYQLNSSNAPVIEYKRSLWREDFTLTWGRFWASKKRVENGKLVTKGTAFSEWCDEIFRWIRTNFKPNPYSEGYIGEEAFLWVSKGGSLCD